MRLDLYVVNSKQVTKSQAQLLIKKELVNIDGKTIKKNGFEVSGKETILIGELPVQVFHAIPNKMPLDIIYEDDDILVINKDRGRQVYPGDEGDMKNTLLSGLRYYYLKPDGTLSIEHLGFAHRIDKETTGVLLTTKNKNILTEIQNQFKDRTVKKIYLALVHGKVGQNGKIIAPIARSIQDRKKMVTTISGREAESDFDVVDYFDDLDITLLKVRIYTGRTHQIRVHLSSINLPIVGDAVYGNTKKNMLFSKKHGFNGQMLHAYYLELDKKIKLGKHKFIAPIKGDFMNLGIDIDTYKNIL